MPNTPVALGVSGSTLGHPEPLGTTLTVWQRPKPPRTLIAPKRQWPQLAHFTPEINMGTGFPPDDECDTQLVEKKKQGPFSKPPIARHEDAGVPPGLAPPPPCPPDDRQ